MRVLGIDPGLASMGYGVVQSGAARPQALALGVIRTEAGRPEAQRLAQIREDLLAIITTHRPEVVALERLFFNANVQTAMSVGRASGVALATSAESGLAVFEYTPPEVKNSVVGVGDASKKQVQVMVGALLGLSEVPRFPDAADACALAICHMNRQGLRNAIGAAR